MTPDPKYFTRTQVQWIYDNHPLKIMEKSRQVGATHATDYRTVSLVSEPAAHFDAFISTRDNIQARLTLENCKRWADFLTSISHSGPLLFAIYDLRFRPTRPGSVGPASRRRVPERLAPSFEI